MSRDNPVAVTDEVRPYLMEIAERLWSTPSHAAIMVGAGFSKNSNVAFPDWASLGDTLFEKIHGHAVDASTHPNRYLNILKLADEVQAAFGRPILHELIRSAMPDDTSQPSDLHVNLLKLPWSDVFTTNYDTLLERSRNNVTSRKYDLVISSEDLVHSEKPRIIKLHGSFGASGPYVITQEDYRRYPSDNAPFVNTVQQSLLENTLCLVGFSGDDPNFLCWIGWIRDNLGNDNSHKIYLVGTFSLSQAQRTLLIQRNIVVVDLGECPGVDGHPGRAVRLFIDYLSEHADQERPDWPGIGSRVWPDSKDDKTRQCEQIAEQWRQVRLTYPGWVTPPYDTRHSLFNYTEEWIDFVTPNELSIEKRIEIAFELDWRLRKCLHPLPDNVTHDFETIVSKWCALSSSSTTKTAVNGLDYCVAELALSLLRTHRESGKLEDWRRINDLLGNMEGSLGPDGRAALHYERALFALFNLDLDAVAVQLQSWTVDDSLPFWQAKRAGIIAELGQSDEAERLLEASLTKIRARLNLKPLSEDYSDVSQEAWVMLLTMLVRDARHFQYPTTSQNEIDDIHVFFATSRRTVRDESSNLATADATIPRSLDDEWSTIFNGRESDYKKEWEKLVQEYRSAKRTEERRLFKERWDILKRYRCDPWIEITLLEEPLKRPAISSTTTSIRPTFDINTHTRTHTPYPKDDSLIACNFLRLFEEAGLPFKIDNMSFGKDAAKGAIGRISGNSPFWALATLVRIDDPKSADLIFSRKALVGYTTSEVDNLIDRYLTALRKIKLKARGGGVWGDGDLASSLAHVLPEILSRLSAKCSDTKRELLLEYLIEVYSSEHRIRYHGIKTLLFRLVQQFPSDQHRNLARILIGFPFRAGQGTRAEIEFLNPFSAITVPNEVPADLPGDVLDEGKVAELLALSASKVVEEREWGCFSLMHLLKLRLLSRDQEEKFISTLWSQTDRSGFPDHTGFHKLAFLDIAHPKGVSPKDLCKQFILDSQFPVSTDGIHFPIDTSLCDEIIGGSKFIEWTPNDIDNIFLKTLAWWENDKKRLAFERDPNFPFFDNSDRAMSRLVEVLIRVVVPHFYSHITEPQRKQLATFVQETRKLDRCPISLELATQPILGGDLVELRQRLVSDLRGNSQTLVSNALHAMSLLYQVASNVIGPTLDSVLPEVAHKVCWRKGPALASALYFVEFLVDRFPAYFTGEFQSLILFGIRELASETKLSDELSDAEFAEHLSLRQAATSLASSICRHFSNSRIALPAEVEIWELIGTSKEEFSEIRAQWQCNNPKH